MEDYGKFQDKGVKGTKSNYLENKNSPFSYSTKMPNPEIFEGYIKRKGIKGRDKKGRFITNKSLIFLLSRSIYSQGITPTKFFSNPFNSAFANLPDELADNFGLDLVDLFDDTMNEVLKDYKKN